MYCVSFNAAKKLDLICNITFTFHWDFFRFFYGAKSCVAPSNVIEIERLNYVVCVFTVQGQFKNTARSVSIIDRVTISLSRQNNILKALQTVLMLSYLCKYTHIQRSNQSVVRHFGTRCANALQLPLWNQAKKKVYLQINGIYRIYFLTFKEFGERERARERWIWFQFKEMLILER